MKKRSSKGKSDTRHKPSASPQEQCSEVLNLKVLEEEEELGEEQQDDEDDAVEAQDMLVPAERLAALEDERDDFKNQVLRVRAEFDNYRKRTARESDQLRKSAAQALVRDLLPVVDNLERALDHIEDRGHPLTQGMEMVKKQFEGVLAGHGVAPISALGQPFDPNLHEALSHQPSEDYAADIVAAEYQRGYAMGGQVLRPTKVVVSSGPPQAAGQTQDPKSTPTG